MARIYYFEIWLKICFIWMEYRIDMIADPNSPENLQITEVTNSSVTLTWLPVTSGGLDYYQSSITPRETLTKSPV